MARPRMREEMKMIAFSLPRSLIEKLDEHAQRLSAATPGVTVSRVEAVRALLFEAVAAKSS